MPDSLQLKSRLFEWCSVALIHANRLAETYDDWKAAQLETSMYRDWVEQGRRPDTSGYVRAHHLRLTWGHVWRLNADIQAFLNSAAQVGKTIHLLGTASYPAAPAGTAVRHARNFEEHWENPYPSTVAQVNPRAGALQFEPGTLIETAHEIWVGGTPLRALHTWVADVQDAVAAELSASDSDLATPCVARATSGCS